MFEFDKAAPGYTQTVIHIKDKMDYIAKGYVDHVDQVKAPVKRKVKAKVVTDD